MADMGAIDCCSHFHCPILGHSLQSLSRPPRLHSPDRGYTGPTEKNWDGGPLAAAAAAAVTVVDAAAVSERTNKQTSVVVAVLLPACHCPMALAIGAAATVGAAIVASACIAVAAGARQGKRM